MSCRKRKVAADLAPPPHDPFLIATSLDSIKPDAKSRKFIRRYVAKGKRPNRPVSRKRVLSSWFDDKDRTYQGSSPVLSLCKELATEILEPEMLLVLHDFVPIMIKVMYPIEQCVDLTTENQHWHDDLAHDPPYAGTVSAIAQVYFNIVRSRDQPFQKLIHTSNSLGPLREQLAAPNVVVTDSLIFMVVALALMSEGSNDLDSASTHLRGLDAMIKLRGGMMALAAKRSLQIKCCRTDLVLAMRTGSEPLLYNSDSLTWKPYLADPAKSPAPPWHTLVDAPDIRLVSVWLDLREFTMSFYLAQQTKRKISPILFQEVLISVQYRLHHLCFMSDDRQGTIRLAIRASEVMLQLFDQKADSGCLELQLWLTFIARMTVLDVPEDEPWLEKSILKTIRVLGLATWCEVRQVLKGFLWVDIIHDKAGERIYNSANNSDIVPVG